MHGLNEDIIARHFERVETHQSGGRPKSRGDAIVTGILADLAVGIIDSITQDRVQSGSKRTVEAGTEPKNRVWGTMGQGRRAMSAEDEAQRLHQPPFVRFWAKLNEQRERVGMAELLYKEARELFFGGKTPVGALTFIGKEWDGLRAVPIFGRADRTRTYHGEFREVTDAGTVWRSVHGTNGAIDYNTPEQALNGARHAKKHSETHSS